MPPSSSAPDRRPRARTPAVAVALATITTTALLAAVPGASAASSPLAIRAADVTAAGPGATTRATVTVRNRGRGTVRGIRLRIRPGAGVTASRNSVRVATSLRAGRSQRVTIRLRTPRALARPVSVRLTASARGSRAKTASFRVRPAAAPSARSLGGRAFWFTYAFGPSSFHERLYFTGDAFVHDAVPTDRVRPACTAVTVSEPGGSGCRRYSFDPATGAVTIEDGFERWSGVLDGRSLRIERPSVARPEDGPAPIVINTFEEGDCFCD